MTTALIRWCLNNGFLVVLGIFALLGGGYYALQNTPVDAIPDIGEKQVIVFADWPGRSPQDVDNQVTYPLTTSLTGTPGVKTIRSMSGFGFSMVFVIFKDDVDYYWARSRVLERMNVAQQRLPADVVPVLGPDATALGQVFWYTLEGEGFDLAELRSIQDWYLRYQLNAVEGVSEVASIGGFVKQYQIDVHPDKLRAHRVTLFDVYEAVRKGNIDVGAKVLEKNGLEFFIRGVGFIKSVEDLEKVVIRQEGGTPIQLKHVSTVTLGPDFRRGALDKDGVEAVGGVALMRYGENPQHVVERLKAQIKQLEAGLPQKTLADGRISKVRIVPFYDRTDIVNETIDTLKEALSEEALMASIVVLIFLLHLRSTASVLTTLPLSVCLCFIFMFAFGVDSNIMSLAGLAIAIGDVADMGIIMTENIYRHMATGDPKKSHLQKITDGATEVGGAIVTAVSNTLVSFIPVFFLTGQEGKLFRPLAFTKTFAIGASVILALTVVPLMCYYLFQPVKWSRRTVWKIAIVLGTCSVFATHAVFMWALEGSHYSGWPMSIVVGVIVALAVVRMTRERFLPLEENPVSHGIARLYVPALRWVLAHKLTFMLIPVLIFLAGISVWLGIGVMLKPVEWAANLGAATPRVQFGELRWQKIRHGDQSATYRMLWRKPTEAEAQNDAKGGLRVVAETRIIPGLGREFMPPLDEGSFLYMPSLLPQAGLGPAIEVNAKQDMAIASVPEVESVVGKLGRAESALDPAPIGMMESIIILKPEDEWRHVPVKRWFSNWPGWLKAPLAWIAPEHRQITKNEILTELQEKTAIPGVLPTFLQPIQTRLVMLQTGFRAMMGVKIYGGDLKEIEHIGLQIESLLKEVPGTTDIVADRIVGKPYLEFHIDRDRIARYGVNIRDVQDVIEVAIGGMNLMESVEGRERYPIRVRYLREFREDIPELEKILVPTSSGAQIPLAQVVTIKSVLGPQEIKGERGLLVGYVTMNTRDRDEVSVVEDAEKLLQAALKDGRLKLPAGYYWEWSGQFENQMRATKRMQILVPVCIVIMFVSLYLGFRRKWIAPVIFMDVIVSLAAGFLLLPLWGANLSVAVWVGFLVLLGVVDDDSVVLSTYLEDIFDSKKMESINDIRESVVQAGLKRIRANLMTIATTVFGLMPVFWAAGRGSDIMQPIALPSLGGMSVSLVTMFIVPCLFCAMEEWKWQRQQRLGTAASAPETAS
ncbi:MAG: efflux RND transporter permease subunit [Prosthecobacter sp.]|uniref:efflux RND transporter permease subunit n=1 Tax=Prosthecobacter sp. TaxID=1965333 RepID=UPI003BAF2077